MMVTEAITLFGKPDSATVKECQVARTRNKNLVDALIRAWHSTLPDPPPGFRLAFIMHAPNLAPVAVATWGRPVARLEDQKMTLELTRQAHSPNCPRNTGTYFLGQMRRYIREKMPEIKRLISYQDAGRHQGTIYKADNWHCIYDKRGEHTWKSRPGRKGTERQHKKKWAKFMKPAIVFDGDDTLWHTLPLYAEAKRKFFEFMEAHGFEREIVESRFHEIDLANVAVHGLARTRFSASMQDTYEELCFAHGWVILPEISEAVRNIGNSVFEAKAKLAKDAMRVLEALKEDFYLVLFTAGDPEVQKARIDDSGLAHFFDQVRIAKTKDPSEWQALFAQTGLIPKKTWAVGNSLRADIAPAAAMGCRCIWLRSGGWAYDETSRPIKERFWKVDRLMDVLAIVGVAEPEPLMTETPAWLEGLEDDDG